MVGIVEKGLSMYGQYVTLDVWEVEELPEEAEYMEAEDIVKEVETALKEIKEAKSRLSKLEEQLETFLVYLPYSPVFYRKFVGKEKLVEELRRKYEEKYGRRWS